jgi:pimeloyl-ACP methyl ester carboxylesterase
MEVAVRGVPIHYVEVGEGRPHLMLHGWPADHHHIQHDLEPSFTDRDGWRRIYPDLPGMGATPSSQAIGSHADMAAIMAEFIDALAPGERFTVSGTSYGGYLARALTHLRGDDMDGFLAYVPAFRRDLTPDLPAPQVLLPNPELVASLAADEQPWASAHTVHSADSLADFRTHFKPAFGRADFAFLQRLDESPPSADPSPMTTPFPGPTLILAGRQDSWCGYAEAWSVLEDYPRATLAVLDRAAHGLAQEQVGLFRALVAEWLDRVEEYVPGALRNS